MKPLLALALIFSLSHAEIEVTELFRAETPEELEAALVDGYPMPWLAEVLADSTIPEEDRYWLDCRMRAAIACNLHLFFDRDGNPVHVDAEWMAPGEDYWQEHIMVNLLEEDEIEQEQRAPISDYEGMRLEIERLRNPPVYSPDRPAMMSSDPGLIMNLFGERVGELAVVNNEVELSRDASVGAVQSGGNEALEHRQRQPYACFLYPDGSFLEIPFDSLGRYRAAVSADGSTIAFVCTKHVWSHPHEAMLAYDNHPPDDVLIDAYVFSSDGTQLTRIAPETPFTGSCRPRLDSSGELLAAGVWGGIGILNCTSGLFLQRIESAGLGRDLLFYSLSPDGTMLCAGGHTAGFVVEIKTSKTLWVGPLPELINEHSVVTCSNNADVIALTMLIGDYPYNYHYEHSVYMDCRERVASYTEFHSEYEEMIVSPLGTFILSREQNPVYSGSCNLPTSVAILKDGE